MLSSPQFTSETVDLEELRVRLRKMSDAELIASGKAARHSVFPRRKFWKTASGMFRYSSAGMSGGVAA